MMREPSSPSSRGAGKTERDPDHDIETHRRRCRRSVTARFGREPAEIGRARRLVRSTLSCWGLHDQITPLELAVSELVTNALVHGEGDIGVELRNRGDDVRLDVTDRGAVPLPPRSQWPRPGVRGGWGLQIIDELSDSWGAAADRDETRVWVARSIDRDDRAG